MKNFFEWFIDKPNIYANIFTLITVIISALISLIISAYYFHRGNRLNLKNSVIHPICRILGEQYSAENYEKISSLSREFSTRYMKDKELKQMNSLLKAYKTAIYNRSEIDVYANALFSYFEYELRKAGVEVRFIPIEYEGEIVDYQYPSDLDYMYDDLKKILSDYNYGSKDYNPYLYGDEDIEYKIITVFNEYVKNFYQDKIISFFNDYSLDQIIDRSKIYRKWIKEIELLDIEKEKFLNLNVCK